MGSLAVAIFLALVTIFIIGYVVYQLSYFVGINNQVMETYDQMEKIQKGEQSSFRPPLLIMLY
ncbi:MAG TPA: hypothetical protein VFT71_08890 [Candidatus Nitrosocosmicus sp.]|jgi:hypothetical protein|nr:hypothetical protein [Candidatus Nitrosocosmicus sp.]HEU5121092.1 hypothetical protein [Candidatus Nitrosocosmicus sp.]